MFGSVLNLKEPLKRKESSLQTSDHHGILWNWDEFRLVSWYLHLDYQHVFKLATDLTLFIFVSKRSQKNVTRVQQKATLLPCFFAEYLRRIEGVQATEVMATKVTINWEKPADLTYVEYYEIRLNISPDEGQIYKTSNNVTIDYKTIDNLSPRVNYYCRVRVSVRFNGNIYKGDWSFQIYFTTTILRKILFVFFQSIIYLTHFSAMFHFYTPWKRQKTKGFEEKRFITSNNEREQKMKQTHSIRVCFIIFLIHYFDIINLLKSDKIHYILIQ